MRDIFSRFTRWMHSLFAWRAVRSAGVWAYLENQITGQRKAVWNSRGYGPLDYSWLRDGDIVEGPRGDYVIGTESEIWNG